MPSNYEMSIEKLQNCISDDAICRIFSSGDAITANKVLLDCLIEKMNHREEILDLCDQLERINTSEQLNLLVNELRSGELFGI